MLSCIMRKLARSFAYYLLYRHIVRQPRMTHPIASNDHPALYPSYEKPALVASADSPSSDHGSRENKLENGAFYDSATSDISPTLSGADEKKLLRRIDWRLLPLLAAMYVIKTIDAQNVSHCKYNTT